MKYALLLIILICAGCTTTYHLEDAAEWNAKHQRNVTSDATTMQDIREGASYE